MEFKITKDKIARWNKMLLFGMSACHVVYLSRGLPHDPREHVDALL